MVCKINHFRARLHSDDRLIGMWCSLSSPTAVELLSTIAYDWFLLDMEHAPNELPDIVSQLRVLDSSGVAPVVRPPCNDRVLIKRLLDAGAKNLLFPNVQSVEEAEEIVRSTRYAPQGVRGVSVSGRAAWYGARAGYLQEAGDEISIGIQIETLAAFECIEPIAALPEVDMVFFGPADLSADMGLLGQTDHADVRAKIQEGISRVRACGKMAGVLAPHVDAAKFYEAAGARFIGIGSDLGCLRSHAQKLLNDMG
ncbi:HpcH/HpaI aldolase/citrate lyase family protein [Diaphorobacter sp.]|uniref:HpcH/HpaI aldolase family protein n=1 Tax=Diaphorobacter sp. TaxID=1934310 RepID=UPI0028A60AE9|nr:HpcH/HpaI aldolase/citrate lyase family protein [Diaphorobacter sp.]